MRLNPALGLSLALFATGCGQRDAVARPAPEERPVAVVRTDLPALPPPDRVAPVTAPFEPFLAHAMANAARPGPGKLRESALIEQSSLAQLPRRLRCREQKPAVLLDLDPGAAAFDVDDPPSPAPGLAAGLAGLRVSGVKVLWIAGLPESEAPSLRTVLRATELDPDGSDGLVLLRHGAERKQLARQGAGREWCIVALAGDNRADFDEAFDYLRDPDGPAGRALEGNIGAGWFLTPLPIG